MRKPLFILFILLLGTLVPAVAQQADFNLNSRRISVQDGLSGNTINELVQDEEGFIWMATNNGLTRYDGYATVNYTSLSGDPKHPLEARIGRMTEEIKSSFYSNLENEKNTEISERLTAEISQQIEQCLAKMAEVVEIPL